MHRDVEFATPQDQYISGDFLKKIHTAFLQHTMSLAFVNLWVEEEQNSHSAYSLSEVGCQSLWDSRSCACDNSQLSVVTYTFNNLVYTAIKAIPAHQLQSFRSVSALTQAHIFSRRFVWAWGEIHKHHISDIPARS
jgi:hypothetical protein